MLVFIHSQGVGRNYLVPGKENEVREVRRTQGELWEIVMKDSWCLVAVEIVAYFTPSVCHMAASEKAVLPLSS